MDFDENANMILDESEFIEYKTSKTSLSKSLFESICAFANTKGGVIFLGVTEKIDNQGKKIYPIEGIDNPQIQEEELSQKLTDPNVLSYNSVESFDIVTTPSGKNLIKIVVNEAPDVKKPVMVAVAKSRTMVAYIRVGSADKVAKTEALQSMLRNQSDELDVAVLANYSIEDLDKTSLIDYRRRVEANAKFAHYQDYSLEEFLEQVGVLAKNRETNEMGITVGGLLFFGKNVVIVQKFPHFQMDLFDRRSDERWRNRISTFNDDLNVYQFFMQSYDYLQKVPLNPFKLDENQQRVDVGDLLKVALREALLNVAMHSDYFSEEHEVIEIYWDYFDFVNAGAMKIPVNSFFTTNASKTRNPVISKLLKFMGFGELAGTGGEQIFNSAKRAKFRFPYIDTDAEKTYLRIWAVDFADSLDGLNDNEKVILKLLSKTMRALSKKEVSDETKLSSYHSITAFNSLLTKGYIEKTGQGRGVKYQLKRNFEQMVASLRQEINDIKIY